MDSTIDSPITTKHLLKRGNISCLDVTALSALKYDIAMHLLWSYKMHKIFWFNGIHLLGSYPISPSPSHLEDGSIIFWPDSRQFVSDSIWHLLSFSKLDGITKINITEIMILVKPMIRNGAINPPTVYSQAPMKGPMR